jgi:methyl-accepting chemotaxis protein
MTNPPYKRRNYFIKKNFQGKLILGYFLFMLGGCFLFTVVLATLSADTLTVVYRNSDIQMGQTPFMLVRQVLQANWIFIVVGGAFVIVAAMFITHHMAGPIFRLERAVENMVNGKLDDVIHLRDKDEGKEIAGKLNQFNRELSRKIGEIDSCARNIESVLAQCAALESSLVSYTDIQTIRTAIADQNEIIRTITGTFQLLDE